MTRRSLTPKERDYLRRSCEESDVPLIVTSAAALESAAAILRARSPKDVSK